MTAQIGDTYTFNNQDYKIIAISEHIDWEPDMVGLIPDMAITACWRGYWCHYCISDEGFFLEGLYIHTYNDKYPMINGIKPVDNPEAIHKHYDGLHIPIDYSGCVLVGDDFLSEYYIHMGLQRFWSYKKVFELVFKDGKLVKTIDHSILADKLRQINLETEENFYKIIENKEKFFGEELLKKYATRPWWL